MNIEIVFEFAKGICSGMDHLHSEGIIHCDLAARYIREHLLLNWYFNRNILLSRSGNIYIAKISDFGLSKSHSLSSPKNSIEDVIPVRHAAPG